MGQTVSIPGHSPARRQPLVRSQVLMGYAAVARGLGLSPETLAAESGLSLATLADFDARISARAFAELLERSATAAQVGDFGLRLAASRSIGALGPLGVVIREEPDLREALKSLQRFLHVHNEALKVALVEDRREAWLVLDVALPDYVDVRHFTELTLGAFARIVSQLLQPAWTPRQVCLKHTAPPEQGTHRKFFRCPIIFDANVNALVFRIADLDAPIVSSDAMLAVYAHKYLDGAESLQNAAIDERVRELIRLWLSTGECSVAKVARGLGVDRRTIHRYLANRRTTFSALLREVRCDTAKELLARNISIAEVGALVGFAYASSFTRWFRTVVGYAPSDWVQAMAEAAVANR